MQFLNKLKGDGAALPPRAPGWSFVAFPTLIGALLLLLVALIYNNATREARYPKYW